MTLVQDLLNTVAEAKKSIGAKLDKKLGSKINDDLRKAGFDGNGRFKSHGDAVNKIHGVLDKHDIQIADVVSADIFREKEKGTHLFNLEFKTDDPHSPQSVSNVGLNVSWHDLTGKDNQYEVVAYITV